MDAWVPSLFAGVVVVVVIIVGIVLLAVARRRSTRAQLAVRITPHAAERMAQRGVSEDAVRKSLARPTRVVATTYVDRGNVPGDGSLSEGDERDSVRLEKDFRARTLKVWVPPDWRSASPIAVKSVAWQYTATLRVPSRKVGVVIGRGGETIKNLQQVYDVRVHVERRSGIVRIVGDDHDAVNRARGRIRDLIGY